MWEQIVLSLAVLHLFWKQQGFFFLVSAPFADSAFFINKKKSNNMPWTIISFGSVPANINMNVNVCQCKMCKSASVLPQESSLCFFIHTFKDLLLFKWGRVPGKSMDKEAEINVMWNLWSTLDPSWNQLNSLNQRAESDNGVVY